MSYEAPGLYEAFRKINANPKLFLQCDTNPDQQREGYYIRSGRFWVESQEKNRSSRVEHFAHAIPDDSMPKFQREVIVPVLQAMITEVQ